MNVYSNLNKREIETTVICSSSKIMVDLGKMGMTFTSKYGIYSAGCINLQNTVQTVLNNNLTSCTVCVLSTLST